MMIPPPVVLAATQFVPSQPGAPQSSQAGGAGLLQHGNRLAAHDNHGRAALLNSNNNQHYYDDAEDHSSSSSASDDDDDVAMGRREERNEATYSSSSSSSQNNDYDDDEGSSWRNQKKKGKKSRPGVANESSAAATGSSNNKKGRGGNKNRTQRFSALNSQQWMEKYERLKEYAARHGNCLVPLDYDECPRLAHWVKRQRCQHKIRKAGGYSTLSDERKKMLDDLGFCWDSHRGAWEERFSHLREFKAKHGHCHVPSTYPPNQSLAIWVKCQRRQHAVSGAMCMHTYHHDDDDDHCGQTIACVCCIMVV